MNTMTENDKPRYTATVYGDEDFPEAVIVKISSLIGDVVKKRGIIGKDVTAEQLAESELEMCSLMFDNTDSIDAFINILTGAKRMLCEKKNSSLVRTTTARRIISGEITDFEEVKVFDLLYDEVSPRAAHTMHRNRIFTLKELICNCDNLTKLRHCGQKTADEIYSFLSDVLCVVPKREVLPISVDEKSLSETMKMLASGELSLSSVKIEYGVYNLKDDLSQRARNVILRLGVDTLEGLVKFAGSGKFVCENIKCCGQKTYDEIMLFLRKLATLGVISEADIKVEEGKCAL